MWPFYDEYMRLFYRNNPTLKNENYQNQISAFIDDKFPSSHLLTPHLKRLGYETELLIPNCYEAQMCWMREYGFKETYQINQHHWIYEITQKQINQIKPDIIYMMDPEMFDSQFILSLEKKPQLVIGWKAASFSENVNWTEYDLILSGIENIRTIALDLGAKATDYFLPGSPLEIEDYVKNIKAEYDIVFTGSWVDSFHFGRNIILENIAQFAHRNKPKFKPAFFLSGEHSKIPKLVASFTKDPRFGKSMHQSLKMGKICLDARANILLRRERQEDLDLGGNDTNNVRLFEATGAGAFLLAENFKKLNDYFKVGTEIEVFNDTNDLFEKIVYYLDHPKKRKEIATKGQQRTLKEHSIKNRATWFHEIITKYI